MPYLFNICLNNVYLLKIILLVITYSNEIISFQSLDYEVVENYVYREEERKKGYPFVVKKNVVRWIIFFWIGVITAAIGIIIDLSIETIADMKFNHVKKCILL